MSADDHRVVTQEEIDELRAEATAVVAELRAAAAALQIRGEPPADEMLTRWSRIGERVREGGGESIDELQRRVADTRAAAERKHQERVAMDWLEQLPGTDALDSLRAAAREARVQPRHPHLQLLCDLHDVLRLLRREGGLLGAGPVAIGDLDAALVAAGLPTTGAVMVALAATPEGSAATAEVKPAAIREGQSEPSGRPFRSHDDFAPPTPRAVKGKTVRRSPEPLTPRRRIEGIDSEPLLDDAAQQRRFGLASWVARADETRDSTERALWRALALATAARTESGSCAVGFQDAAAEAQQEDLGKSPLRRLALAAGLAGLRCAPHFGATELIGKISVATRDGPVSVFIADLAAVARDHGALNALLTRSEAPPEGRLRELAEIAAAELQHPRAFTLGRATALWAQWMDPGSRDPHLARLLLPLARLDIPGIAVLDGPDGDARGLRGLRRSFDHDISVSDANLRGSGSRPLDGKAKRDVYRHATRIFDVVAEAVELARQATRTEEARYVRQVRERLAASARTAREWLHVLAPEWLADGSSPAASRALVSVLRDMFELLDVGAGMHGSDPEVAVALARDLVMYLSVPLDEDLQPPADLTVGELAPSQCEPDPVSVVRARIKRWEFDLAALAKDLVDDADTARALEGEARDAHERALREVVEHHESLTRRIERAHSLWQLEERDEIALTGNLETLKMEITEGDVRPSRPFSIHRAIDELDAAFEAACESRRLKLQERYAKALATADQALRDDVAALFEAEDYAACEELLSLAQRPGTTDPDPDTGAVAAHPGLFDAVLGAAKRASELTEASVMAAIAARASVAGLDFSSTNTARATAAATSWFGLARLHPGEHAPSVDIVNALRGCGLLATTTSIPASSGPVRAFRVAAQPLGRPRLPFLGSRAVGRYDIRLAPAAYADANSLAAQAVGSDEVPVLLLCFGVLTAKERLRLANRLRSLPASSVSCVIDTPAFLAMLSDMDAGIAALEAVTLPLTAVNPYTPYVAGRVEPELFAGRDREVRELLARNGYGLIFGGRRLGKSSLMRHAAQIAPGDVCTVYIDVKQIGARTASGTILSELLRGLHRALHPGRGELRELRVTLVQEDLRALAREWLDGGPERRIVFLLDECDAFFETDAAQNFETSESLLRIQSEFQNRVRFVFAGLHAVARFGETVNLRLHFFGEVLEVGPLAPRSARRLIEEPLAVLGYRLPDAAVYRILTLTRNQPSLIQLCCHHLVRALAHQERARLPIVDVPYETVAELLEDRGLVDEIRTRTDLTLLLDPRYLVIANVVALHALDNGNASGMRTRDVRAGCDDWWPEGFADTEPPEFRALVRELAAMGVLLAHDDRISVSSANVVRMLGTRDVIEGRLLDAHSLRLSHRFDGTVVRQPLVDDHGRTRPNERSVLTLQQVQDLLSIDGRLRVVVGAPATGINAVTRSLEAGALTGDGRAAIDVEVPAADLDGARFLTHIRRARTGRVKVVVTDRRSQRNGWTAWLERSQRALQSGQSEGNVQGVVLARPHVSLFQALLAASQHTDRAAPAWLALRRWERTGLRLWAFDEVDVPFAHERELNRLMAATSGWPALVDDVVRGNNLSLPVFDERIEALIARLESKEGAERFLQDVGFAAAGAPDDGLSAAFGTLVEWGDPIPNSGRLALLEDLTALFGAADEPPRTEALHRTMVAMDVLELDAARQAWRPEPLTARCWQTARLSAIATER